MRHDFLYFCFSQMVAIAQLVRALDCGSKGRGFEPHWLPQKTPSHFGGKEFFFYTPSRKQNYKLNGMVLYTPFIKNPC